MDDDALGILARELRDQRDEAVPERERVPGMQAAVGELRDPVERELVEVEQLPYAREVEQAVAVDRGGDDPEQHADDSAPEERPRPTRWGGHPGGPRAEAPQRHAGGRNDDEQGERQRQRRAERERDRERAEDGDERPGEGRRQATHTERSREQPARCEQEGSREREPEIEKDHGQRSTRVAASADASHVAPSRYARPRSPRKTSPRSRSDASNSRRARSATFGPRCFVRKRRCPRRFSR